MRPPEFEWVSDLTAYPLAYPGIGPLKSGNPSHLPAVFPVKFGKPVIIQGFAEFLVIASVPLQPCPFTPIFAKTAGSKKTPCRSCLTSH